MAPNSVRLKEQEQEQLRQLAQLFQETQSEVLRRGLQVLWAQYGDRAQQLAEYAASLQPTEEEG